MRVAMARFHKSIEEIWEFLRFAAVLERQRQTAGFSVDLVKHAASSTWRRQVYAFSIVGLYGAHERFVRDLVAEVAVATAEIYGEYSELPQVVRANHVRLSLQAAVDAMDGSEVPGDACRDLVAGLHGCFNGGVRFNGEIFAAGSANIRSGTVSDLLKRLDVVVPSINEEANVATIVGTELNGVYASATTVVDDLVERRNQIAHGSDFELCDIGTIASIAKVVYQYGCTLYAYVSTALLERLVKKRFLEVAVAERVYSAQGGDVRSVATVAGVARRVHVGDYLYLLRKGVRRVKVASIEQDRLRVDVAAPDSGRFGIDFSVTVKNGERIVVLPGKYAALEAQLLQGREERVRPLDAA